MTVNDIKVGQTYKWHTADMSFTIVGFDGKHITWIGMGGNPSTNYDYLNLINCVNRGQASLVCGANRIGYKMDRFKFV
jgi:hypothetical protein